MSRSRENGTSSKSKMASFFIPRSVQNKGKNKAKLDTHECKSEKKAEKLARQFDNKNIKKGNTNFASAQSARTAQVQDEDEDQDEAAEQQQTKHRRLEKGESDEEEDEVISFSKNQRWPAPGEPACMVCGRYGAYICDQTDKDVCSLECKAKHLRLEAKTKLTNIEENSRLTADKTENNIQLEHARSLEQLQPSFEAGTSACVEVGSKVLDSHFTYNVHPTILSLTEDQVQQLRKNTEINVKGDNVPHPILEFEHCQFHETLISNLRFAGYHTPTPVQMQVIPLGLDGRDVMACAQTGSGKTAAFILPMIARIHHEVGQLPSRCPSLSAPRGLVMAPTRELCMQIEEQTKVFMKGLWNMRTALVVGGLPLPPQVHRLQSGIQLVIATPGRLLEVLAKADIDMSCVKTLVLDEVDTMLQLGFEGQVKQIIQKLPTQRQSLLFSATIPTPIERLAEQLLSSPVYVSVGLPSAPSAAVKQIILWVEDKSKKKRLFSILQDRKHFKPPVVVFVDSKMGADLLSEAIEKTCGISCVSMHSDKSQEERNRVLQSFLAGAYPVIVCTGVLGRGIDLVNVKQVINFDMPPTVDEYIHQIGRAGRLGTIGWALTFINSSNKKVFLDLVLTLEPLGVNLPPELVNSPFLHQQRHKQTKGDTKRKRKHRNEFVTQDNLMDLLKRSSVRRKR